jgi:hypothetical protein
MQAYKEEWNAARDKQQKRLDSPIESTTPEKH